MDKQESFFTLIEQCRIQWPLLKPCLILVADPEFLNIFFKFHFILFLLRLYSTSAEGL